MEGFDFLKENINVLAAGVVKRLPDIQKQTTVDGIYTIMHGVFFDDKLKAAKETRKKWENKILRAKNANDMKDMQVIVYNFVLAASGLKVIK